MSFAFTRNLFLLKLPPLILRAEGDDWVLITQRYIDSLIAGMREILHHALLSILGLALDLARVAYIVMAVIGLLMWASGFSTYSGRKLLIGSLILAVLVEVMNGLVGV
ncbi:MAG: hypothetical protein J7L11_10770 [Thermoprotei archaeon]|nr:hypothetical protein [Thermoprotei archaeon]